MYIFIDESGDLGFDFEKKGLSNFFTITALVCKNDRVIKEFGYAVKRTRRNVIPGKQRSLNEFKGSNLSLRVKKYFLKQSPKKDWEIYSVTIRKKDFKHLINTKKHGERLYNSLARVVVQNIPVSEETTFVKIVIDKSKDDKGVKTFNHYIALHLESALPMECKLKIQHMESHKDICLQCVDMFCWGINNKYEKDDSSWYQTFEKFIKQNKFIKKERRSLSLPNS
jgi:hypothetical protein